MTDQHLVNIKVKPYVKQYLINNCGNPCNISLLPEVNKEFLKHLSKPLFSRESLPVSQRNDDLCIVIPEWIFYKYGWEITKSGQQDFNAFIERRIKFIARSWIGCQTGIGFTTADSIRAFQDKFNFPEDVWSYEAIKKDLQRNSDCEKNKKIEHFLIELSNDIHLRILNNLSEEGTYISKRHKNELSKIG